MPNLKIRISASIEQLKAGLAEAKGRLGSFANNLRGGLNSVVGNVGSMLTLGSVVRGFGKLVDTMDQIGKSSRALGMTATGYQQIYYAARRATMPQDRLNMSFQRMANFMQRVNEGGVQEDAILKRLGLDYNALIKMTPDQQFITIGEAIDKVVNATERLALANKIYGRGARDVLNMVRGYQIAVGELHAAGGIISDEDIQAAEDLKDKIETLKTKVMAMASRGGQAQYFGDLLSKFSDELKNADKQEGFIKTYAATMLGGQKAIFDSLFENTKTKLQAQGLNKPVTAAEKAAFRKRAEELKSPLPKPLMEEMGKTMNRFGAPDAYQAIGGYLSARNTGGGVQPELVDIKNAVVQIELLFRDSVTSMRGAYPTTVEKKLNGGGI